MSRKARNKLTLTPPDKPGGLFFLDGYINGKQVRKQSQDGAKLAALQTEMETAAAAATMAEDNGIRTVATFLSRDQIEDAQAAFRKLAALPCSLLDCVETALRHMRGAEKDALEALEDWQAYQKALEIREATLDENLYQTTAFLAKAKVKFVAEITRDHIEKYVLGAGTKGQKVKPSTKYHRGSVIRAFLNFCVSKEWLAVTPYKIDMGQLGTVAKHEHGRRRLARQQSKTNILIPDQCAKLLQASATEWDGLMLPYTVFTLWCMMRSAEAQRVTWNDVDCREDGSVVITVVRHKNSGSADAERPVTVPANVAPIIQLAYRRAKEADELNEEIPYSRAIWENIRDSAGLLTRTKKISAKGFVYTKIVKTSWYENLLRHTGLSYLFKSTNDLISATQQAGNTPEVAIKRYIEKTSEADAKAFYAITLSPAELPRAQVA